MQSLRSLIFPPQCAACDEIVTQDYALCGSCWQDCWFISGLVCDACGVPLPGEDTGGTCLCDDCLEHPRPWRRGRAVFQYRDKARQLVLQLKHSDRSDLARPAGAWLANAARPLLSPDSLVVPVPLHWRRLVKRRYNQAALMGRAMTRISGHNWLPDLLTRPVATPMQGQRDRAAREANLRGAIAVNARHAGRLAGARILLIDDVMASGATFEAATRACLEGGAAEVCVLALARSVKED